MHETMQRLADMPRLGHTRTDLAGADVRFWVRYPYVIVYRADARPIHVLRVVDGHRDIDAMMR
jgi:plasmid stabilization system protein ParE